jgi:hypothetical protein
LPSYGIIKVAVTLNVTDTTKADVEYAHSLIVSMYQKAVENAAEFAKPCQAKTSATVAPALNTPITYTKDGSGGGVITLNGNQSSAQLARLYEPGELPGSEDTITAESKLNDFGITKCNWAFVVFHNASTSTLGNAASGAISVDLASSNLHQVTVIYDPPRENGMVKALNTVDAYISLPEANNTTSSSNTLSGAFIVTSAHADSYAFGSVCANADKKPFKTANRNNSGTAATIKTNACPVISCALVTASDSQTHLVHQTAKSGTTLAKTHGSSTFCDGRS